MAIKFKKNKSPGKDTHLEKAVQHKHHPGTKQEEISHPDGGKQSETEQVDGIIATGPVAYVGVRCAKTTNIGNYESVKIEISLNYPSPPDEDSVTETFNNVKDWVDKRLSQIIEELEAASDGKE